VINLRPHGSQQRCNQAQIAGEPKCEAQEAEAPENVGRESRSSEGRGLEAARRRLHQRSNLPPMVSECGDGPQEEQKVANVYIFREPKQVMPQR
jgi:hypothetical protein